MKKFLIELIKVLKDENIKTGFPKLGFYNQGSGLAGYSAILLYAEIFLLKYSGE